MNQNVLNVWLHGEHLAELEHLRNGKLRLRFTSEAVTAYGVASQVLSLSLPVTTKRVEGRQLDAFVRGLMPEGNVRAMIEHENRTPYNDDFALLRAIGAECAGAVQFLPLDQAPGDGVLRPLTDAETARIVQNLPTIDAPDGLPVTASLGGIQPKVLLTQTEAGWAWPARGAASTHIIKPEPNSEVLVEFLIQSENWASRLAENAGLTSAHTELRNFDGRLAIVVERYDRRNGMRLHQEDFTQALGLGVQDKYERSGVRPGRLERIAKEAGSASLDPPAFREQLLRMVTFNALIGNADAHSKNYSLLIDAVGNFALAPLYDTAPVMLMNRNLTTSGHAIDGQADLRYVTRQHLEAEAGSWDMPSEIAEAIIESMAESTLAALQGTPPIRQLSYLPQLIRTRAHQLLTGKTMQYVRVA